MAARGGDKPHNEIKIEVSVSMAHVKLKGPKKYKYNETFDVTVVRAHSKEKLPKSEGEGKKETALKRSTTNDKYEDKEWVLIFTRKRNITEKNAKYLRLLCKKMENRGVIPNTKNMRKNTVIHHF